jgi:cysteine desulfuration protein SufE
VSPNDIIQFSNQLDVNDADILKTFATENGWQNKYRRIMFTGKLLPNFADDWKTEESRVQGCESDVWLHAVWENDTLRLAANSNAKIVRGLVAIVLAGFANKSIEQLQHFNHDEYFNTLGLLEHLSPSRGNGIKAIVAKIEGMINDAIEGDG